MPISFPTSLDDGTSIPNSRTAGDSGSASDNNAQANALLALEAKVGANSSAVATSLDYLVKNTASINPGHKHGIASLTDFTTARSTGDVTNATTTPAAVPGLSFSFAANSFYVLEFWCICTSAAATTGYGFSLDTDVAVTTVATSHFHQLANTGTLSGGNSFGDNTVVGVSSGVPTLATSLHVYVTGMIASGVDAGTVQLMFRPEVSASASLLQNSLGRMTKVA